ncbi:MAG: ATP-binding cassette domain-containing protein, partial [Thermoplasmatota archaeon]
MSRVLLDARGLSLRYPNGHGIENVSLQVDEGEILGLLGPNGAGKTTTIRILTTLLKPTRGSFTLAGKPSSNPGEIRALIGVLPESTGYASQQTGIELL